MSLPTSRTSSTSRAGGGGTATRRRCGRDSHHRRQVLRPRPAGRPTRPGRRRSRARCRRPARTTSWAASHGMSRVVPLQPGQRDAVGRRPRVGDEVRAADQHRVVPSAAMRTISLTTSAARPPAGCVSRTASSPPSGDPTGRRAGRRPAPAAPGHRDRALAAGVQPVQPLVGEVGEPQHAAGRPSTRRRRTRAPGCGRSTAAGRTSVDRPVGGAADDRPTGRPRAGRASDHQTSFPSTHDLAEPRGRARRRARR